MILMERRMHIFTIETIHIPSLLLNMPFLGNHSHPLGMIMDEPLLRLAPRSNLLIHLPFLRISKIRVILIKPRHDKRFIAPKRYIGTLVSAART